MMPSAAAWLGLETIILSEIIKERQASKDIPYMRNLKKRVQMNLLTKKKQSHRLRKQIYGFHKERSGEG